jgi:hypothetical protein
MYAAGRKAKSAPQIAISNMRLAGRRREDNQGFSLPTNRNR